jgi:L,D-transpeptidase YcbB
MMAARQASWLTALVATLFSAPVPAAAAPLWFSAGRPTPQAVALLSELRHAEQRGLRATDYGFENGGRGLPDLDISTSQAVDQASVDTRLTLAGAHFISNLHNGRVDPRRAGYDLNVSPKDFNVDDTLKSLAKSTSVSDALNDIEPQFLHYKLLKAALSRYRALALRPELTQLPDSGQRAIKPGGLYVGAASLRTLLSALGDLAQADLATDAFRLDPDTVNALKKFQARHGLTADGSLGRDTYRALTTPLSHRVRQIELSLERWRWLPAKLDAPAIIVNVPQFRLFALYTAADIEGAMLKMDVIVGKSFPIMQTPVFAADMRYIVLHPYWDVPYSILRRELLPSIRRDSSFIARNGYQIVSGPSDSSPTQGVTSENIEALARGTLRLRQQPGPKNPLGFVKFVLPNRYDVYLHGTSAPALFAGAQRAFSHGCIRVSDPMALIQYALRGDANWDAQKISRQLGEPGPYRINLHTPIRVFVVYTTALEAEDGRTLFFPDIYGHDARLEELLSKSRPDS